MSIIDHIAFIQQQHAEPLLREPPPACLHLFERAQAAGFPVKQLYVVRHPLTRWAQGGYDRNEQAIWLSTQEITPDAPTPLLEGLIYLLAHAQSASMSPPSTIEQDWQEELATWRRAVVLAAAWGYPDLFPPLFLETLSDQLAELIQRHVQAGRLAGSSHPRVARLAYQALHDLQQHYGWDALTFAQALAESSEEGLALLGFNRSCLRPRWRHPPTSPGSFGAMAVLADSASQGLLRDTLAHIAERPAMIATLPWFSYEDETGMHQTCLLPIEEASPTACLSQVVHMVNTLLLSEPERVIEVRCEGYADRVLEAGVLRLPRLYHVQIRTFGVPPTSHLWVLFPHPRDPQHRRCEAAWQQYLCSWNGGAQIMTDTLHVGWQRLWWTWEAAARDARIPLSLETGEQHL